MTTTSTAHESAPRRGEILAGKYEVEEVLGSGGMGVVVAARHTALRQKVAIKFLLPRAMLLPDATERFLREARSSVAIKGEHVARVLDVGTLETGAPYMVMEHLEGSDLRALLKARGPLGVEEALDLFLQACEAVAEAHSIGIIHRDIKPANVFVTRRPDGRPLVKVLDFGLSKVLSSSGGGTDESLTETGFAAGSACYASPEQLRDLKGVDARADIWALGVMLFEMLTRQRPFAGTTMTAVAMSIGADMPPSLTALRPEIPPAVDAIVQRCLQKDPQNRPAFIAEIACALAPFASGASGATSVDSILRLAPPTARAALSVPPSAALTPSFPPPTSSVPVAAGKLGADSADPSTLARSAWSDSRGGRRKSRTLLAIAAAVLLLGAGASIARVAFPPEAPGPAAPAAQPPSSATDSPPPSAVVVAPALPPTVSAADSASARPSDTAKTAASAAPGSKSAPAWNGKKKKGDLLDRWQ